MSNGRDVGSAVEPCPRRPSVTVTIREKPRSLI